MNNYNQLPAYNLSQKLFYSQLPQCDKKEPDSCCSDTFRLNRWYESSPQNLWNQVRSSTGGPPSDNCIQKAFYQQCLMSQHYNYLSGNNKLPKTG